MNTRFPVALILAATAFAVPASAFGGEANPQDVAVMAECLAAAGEEPLACLGRVQKPCLDQPGGESTAGSIMCADRERFVWAARLDAAAKAVEARQPARLEMFHAAQAAWAEYRDALCKYEASAFLGGSLGKVVAADCQLRETAARAIDLAAEAHEAATE